MTLVLFFTVGFLRPHPYQGMTAIPHEAAKKEILIPYYDDVVLEQQGHELELKENVAYAPASTITL